MRELIVVKRDGRREPFSPSKLSDKLRIALTKRPVPMTEVDRIVREHMTGRRDHTLRLWALVVFELWHRQYLDPAPTVYAPAFAPPVSVAS